MAYVSPRGFFNRGEVGSAGYRPLPRRRRSPLVSALAHIGGFAPSPVQTAPPVAPVQAPPDEGQQEQALLRFRRAAPPVGAGGAPGFLGPPVAQPPGATASGAAAGPGLLGPPVAAGGGPRRLGPPVGRGYGQRRRGIVNSLLGL